MPALLCTMKSGRGNVILYHHVYHNIYEPKYLKKYER